VTVLDGIDEDEGSGAIFVVAEDERSFEGISDAVHPVSSGRKDLSTDHKFGGDLELDSVESLAFGSHAQTGQADQRNQDTQVLLSHYFSFDGLVRVDGQRLALKDLFRRGGT
jgi:hypothetical protein